MNYLEFTTFLLPEIILLLTALGAIGLGTVPRGRPDSRHSEPGPVAAVSVVGILMAGAVMLLFPQEGSLLGGMIVLDPLTRTFRLVVLVMTLLAVILLKETPPTRHCGENFALVLFAAIGLMLVVGTEELLVLFLGLELAGLSLYVV